MRSSDGCCRVTQNSERFDCRLRVRSGLRLVQGWVILNFGGAT